MAVLHARPFIAYNLIMVGLCLAHTSAAAVLSCLLAVHLLLCAQVLPTDANEGELSMGKARLVRNLRLAQLGSNSPLLLQYQLRFHPFDNSLWTPTGDSSVLGLFAGSAAHTLKGKRIADGIESLIGAFYLAGAAQEAAQATAGSSSGTAAAAAAAASSAGGGGGGGLCDAASWVWHRVSRPGLVAAAALCEALSVLPAGEGSRQRCLVGRQCLRHAGNGVPLSMLLHGVQLTSSEALLHTGWGTGSHCSVHASTCPIVCYYSVCRGSTCVGTVTGFTSALNNLSPAFPP